MSVFRNLYQSILFSIVLFAGMSASSAHAQKTIPGPSFEQVLSLRSAGSPSISPDGSAIVFGMNTTDWNNNRYDSELWLARENEQPFQLTRTKDGSSSSARWSPDSRWIAFQATRGEKQQIYLIRSDGGEAQAVTETKEGTGSFRWSPDGSRIAFVMSEPESSEMEKRTEQFGDYAVEDVEYRHNHLWVVEVQPDMWPSPAEVRCEEDTSDEEEDDDASSSDCLSLPKPERLTQGDFSVGAFEWSPDGSRIAFEHRENPLLLSFMTTEIHVLTLATGDVRPVVSGPSYYSGPQWSPDSESLLYYTTSGDASSTFYANNQLLRIPATGGASRRLATGLDEDISAAKWTNEGIFLLAREKTKRHLFRVNPETGRFSKLSIGPDRIRSFEFSNDAKTFAMSGQTDTTLTEVYRGVLGESDLVNVTNMTDQIDGWQTGTSEVVAWESYDGTPIEGVLHKPEDFDLDKQYPLMVIIHGGPTGIDSPAPVLSYVYPANQWLAKGALVLRPNYRGSAGYGEEFRALNVRNLGVGDAWDVMSGVDYLIDTGVVDTTRMGAMGWSQGGYISAFLTTNTDRFNAISVGAGISNWMTYYVNTDIHPFTRQYLKGTPWSDPEIYALTSPMTTINEASTPTLIQHGEFDNRVPIPNAYELYQGLQDVGVETELVVYKRFGHGISRPKERLAAVWHNWQWFAKHVWEEDVTLPFEDENE